MSLSISKNDKLSQIRDCLREGEIAKALAELALELEKAPSDVELNYLLVVTLRLSQQLDKSLLAVNELLQLAPSHA